MKKSNFGRFLPEEPVPDGYISREEASRYLNISPTTLYRHEKKQFIAPSTKEKTPILIKYTFRKAKTAKSFYSMEQIMEIKRLRDSL